mmetsp:Transcript_25542/g.61525  ORF Transcript_25542/g.61525 Transcript_25542/m.61525 type:complete len:184 (+) Transcript_25542:3-554(+)
MGGNFRKGGSWYGEESDGGLGRYGQDFRTWMEVSDEEEEELEMDLGEQFLMYIRDLAWTLNWEGRMERFYNPGPELRAKGKIPRVYDEKIETSKMAAKAPHIRQGPTPFKEEHEREFGMNYWEVEQERIQDERYLMHRYSKALNIPISPCPPGRTHKPVSIHRYAAAAEEAQKQAEPAPMKNR